MLNSNIGTVILNGLFGLSNGNSISFGGDVYLGLLTRLPNANGQAYEDGKYFSEPADPGYLRIKINSESRINKKLFVAPAQLGDVIDVDGDKSNQVYVTNQGLIMFPESTVGWDRVVGFGLFRSNNTLDNALPFLWGTVTADGGEEGVSVEQYEVPIIRQGGFKISFM